MTRVTLTALVVVILGVGSAFAFTPAVSGVPDVIIGDQTPEDGITPGDIVTAGDTRENQGPLANVFDFPNAFNIYDLVSDTADQSVSSGFTSDDSMLYSFTATPASPAAGTAGVADIRISINGLLIGVGTDATAAVTGVSGELTFKDEAFSADANASAIAVQLANFTYDFGPNNHPTWGPAASPAVTATADVIDLNVLTVQVTNLQSNVATEEFLVYTVDDGPDATSATHEPGVSQDLSAWIWGTNSLALFTLVEGTATSAVTADDDGDGSISDLTVTLDSTTADSSINNFRSPPNTLAHDADTIYRTTWNVDLSSGTAPVIRARANYGFGSLGSHHLVANGLLAPPSASGTDYTLLIESPSGLASASAGTALDPTVPENSLQLALDVYEFYGAGDNATVTLNCVTTQALTRAVILAVGTLEKQVTDFTDTGQVVEGADFGDPDDIIIFDLTATNQAAMTTVPGTDHDGTLGADDIGFAMQGLVLVPIIPTETTGRIYRGLVGFDASANTASTPLSQHILQISGMSSVDNGILLPGETVIRAVDSSGVANPALNASGEATAWVVFPAGVEVSATGAAGDSVGVQLSHAPFAVGSGGSATFTTTGSTIVDQMELHSYPESILP